MLTPSQQQALDFRHHLSVTANAGAGKTTVLVHRFIEILLNTDAQINELVAITFTEKAASDLRKRIADHVEEKIQGSANRTERVMYERIRDGLVAANIGTIHSFCAQLLREFPIEADVDVGFAVLEGIDQQLHEGESLREAFDAVLNNPEKTKDRENLVDLVRMLGRHRVENYLRLFIQKREQIERLKILKDNEPSETILYQWHESVIGEILSRLSTPEWQSSMRMVLSTADGKTAGEVNDLFARWSDRLSPQDKISLISKIQNLVFTQKFGLRKEFIGKTADLSKIEKEVNLLSGIHQSVDKLLKCAEDVNSAEADKTLLRMINSIIVIYRQATSRYEEKKITYGKLDFEDILVKTNNLLENESVRKALGKKFKYIMVDEFQDTNRLQYEILILLTSGLQSGNLFIVGDPKQSIYGFRDAEVEIFNKMKSEIIITQNGKEIILAESFRLLPNLVGFVNRVFAPAMNRNSSPFDVAYEELVLGRQTNAKGLVELLLLPDQKKEAQEGDDENIAAGENDPVVEECEQLAARILQLATEGEVDFLKRGDVPQKLQFRDIAILLRSRTHLRTLEKVFTTFKIPYVLSGGIGYYQTQEVIDFLNYLQFLLTPEDDVAFAGILRSPFFTLSDTEIFLISLVPGNSYWEKARNYIGSGKSSKRLNRAVGILSHHRQVANRLSIPLLLQQIFLHTGWRGIVAGLPMGKQNDANISKLLRLARDFESQGYVTLYDFVHRFKTLVGHEEREGQASLELHGNCVQIMTVHAAKGLEFPVVFIPFAHKKFRYEKEPFIDTDYGIGFSVRAEKDLNEEVTPAFCELLKVRSKQKTEAEEKRIFYVACTRARDALIISGQYDSEDKNPSYLRWTMEGLNISTGDLRNGELVFPPTPMRVLDVADEHSIVLKNDYRLSVNIFIEKKILSRNHHKNIEEIKIFPKKEIYLTKAEPRLKGEIFSATQIKTYLECPQKYYLKYILGMPETNSIPANFDELDEPDDLLRGDEEGMLTHAVLQTLDTEVSSDDELRYLIQKSIAVKAPALAARLPEATDVILTNVKNFIDSPLGKETLSAKETRSEFPVSMVFGDDFLTGTIDKIYKDGKGNWQIIDYKTDHIPLDQVPNRAEIYKPQLLFYCLLLQRLYGQKDFAGTLIFLRHPLHPVVFKFTQHDINDFTRQLQKSISEIKIQTYSTRKCSCGKCVCS